MISASLIEGDWSKLGALFLVIFCLGPAYFLSVKVNIFSVQLFCFTSLSTQLITVFTFYTLKSEYSFMHHREFYFRFYEVLSPLLLVGSFLFCTILLTILLEKIFKTFQDKNRYVIKNYFIQKLLNHKNRNNSKKYVLLIIMLIFISFPIKVWMFNRGIGLVGIEPPRLPFRLSGILFYTFSYLFPVIISALYVLSNNLSFKLTFLITFYSFLIGIASLSKGVFLLSFSPVLIIALINKKWFTILYGFTIFPLSIFSILAARGITYATDGLGVYKNSIEFLSLLKNIFLNFNFSIENLAIFSSIAGRVEGFESLFLASKFDVNKIGGSFNIFLKTLSSRFINFDHDILHYEFLGYTIPLGFHNVSGTINTYMLFASNNNLIFLFIFSAYLAVILIFIEKMTLKALIKYNLNIYYFFGIIFISTLWFYTGPGTFEINFILFILLLMGSLPKIEIK